MKTLGLFRCDNGVAARVLVVDAHILFCWAQLQLRCRLVQSSFQPLSCVVVAVESLAMEVPKACVRWLCSSYEHVSPMLGNGCVVFPVGLHRDD